MDEFEDLYQTFQTDARASLFCFVTLFTFEDDSVLFLGERYRPEAYDDLKSLFRKARKRAFQDDTSPDLARQLIWFCAQKMLYAKAANAAADASSEESEALMLLNRSERRELILLADMYIERT